MHHSCVLLLCEVTHNNHLAGSCIQSWKRKPGIVFCTLLTLLSVLHLANSCPADSDLYLGGTVLQNPSWHHHKTSESFAPGDIGALGQWR